MTKHMHRATGAPTRRAQVPTKRAATLTTPPVFTAAPLVRETSLAEHQDAENPASNDTGKPTTPSEMGSDTKDDGGDGPSSPAKIVEEGREEEKDEMPGAEVHEGAVMDWFDRIGE
jgi:hypothetical protein